MDNDGWKLWADSVMGTIETLSQKVDKLATKEDLKTYKKEMQVHIDRLYDDTEDLKTFKTRILAIGSTLGVINAFILSWLAFFKDKITGGGPG